MRREYQLESGSVVLDEQAEAPERMAGSGEPVMPPPPPPRVLGPGVEPSACEAPFTDGAASVGSVQSGSLGQYTRAAIMASRSKRGEDSHSSPAQASDSQPTGASLPSTPQLATGPSDGALQTLAKAMHNLEHRLRMTEDALAVMGLNSSQIHG
mmetsp:Transcript_4618/g.14650  ORF Transcript_4618/g.14650 Transcript_4618/m.14650 type:complete len:154 (+) Transcript_4618:917-1378(+)